VLSAVSIDNSSTNNNNAGVAIASFNK